MRRDGDAVWSTAFTPFIKGGEGRFQRLLNVYAHRLSFRNTTILDLQMHRNARQKNGRCTVIKYSLRAAQLTAFFFVMLSGWLMPTAATLAKTGGGKSDTVASAYPSSWPMYGFNAAHDAAHRSEGGSGQPASWKFAVPNAIPLDTTVDAVKKEYVSITAVRDLVGIPVGVSIVDGIVYVPGDDGYLYALDAADGKLLWKFDAHNQIMTTPVVAATAHDKMVYVGGGNSDFTYSEAVKFADPDAHVVRGTGISGIYALDAKSGKLVWAYHTRGEDMPTPAFYNGKVVFGNGDGHIYGLDAATGKELWKIDIGSFVSMSSATVSGDLVIMAGTHPDNLYAVDADTGTLAWKTPLAAYSSSVGDCAPAAADGIVVTQIEAVGTKPGKVASKEVAVDAKTGKILWTTTLGMGAVPPRNKDAVPMIHDGVVYTGSPVTKTAYALNLKDGRILWSRHLARMKAAPAVDSGQVFFPLGNGTIAVLDKASGKVANLYKSGNGGFGPQNPVIINGTMYIGTNFGWVNAIPIADVVAKKITQP
ncbi:MAG TPA: PQQ-binding-like beta-propeller repeat protein [Burkholderiales bacterium]|nr:PQQ-binding-like beta-propeller repeat protein [Burkholderiales bacterium]